MSATPVLIRRDLAARLTGVGLREATGPLGAGMEPSTVIDRSFDIVMGDDQDAGQRVQFGVTMRVNQIITIRLAHRIKPSKAGDTRDQGLSDRAAIMRALLTRTATDSPRAAVAAQFESTLTYRNGSTEDRGGGAYTLATLVFGVAYQLDLTGGAS